MCCFQLFRAKAMYSVNMSITGVCRCYYINISYCRHIQFVKLSCTCLASLPLSPLHCSSSRSDSEYWKEVDLPAPFAFSIAKSEGGDAYKENWAGFSLFSFYEAQAAGPSTTQHILFLLLSQHSVIPRSRWDLFKRPWLLINRHLDLDANLWHNAWGPGAAAGFTPSRQIKHCCAGSVWQPGSGSITVDSVQTTGSALNVCVSRTRKVAYLFFVFQFLYLFTVCLRGGTCQKPAYFLNVVCIQSCVCHQNP